MRKYHAINNLRFTEDSMIVEIDGTEKEFKLSNLSQRLLNASQLERSTFEVTPSGYGIHWTLIDEDLSVDGLLGIRHLPQQIEKSA